jgi:hypothetical protein
MLLAIANVARMTAPAKKLPLSLLGQTDVRRERVAAFPPGNSAPEEPYVRAFPAYGSRTTLSVSLTPVVSIRHTAFADVTSLIHLIIEAKSAEP